MKLLIPFCPLAWYSLVCLRTYNCLHLSDCLHSVHRRNWCHPSNTPFLMCATAHFSFQTRPMSSIAVLITLKNLFNLLCYAQKTSIASTYNSCVVYPSMGFHSFYPSVALSFHAIGLIHSVKSFGQRTSPCGSPLLKYITSDVSCPCLVWATIFVFQLLLSLSTVLHNQ